MKYAKLSVLLSLEMWVKNTNCFCRWENGLGLFCYRQVFIGLQIWEISLFVIQERL